ncbi:MAG: hypothetical protein AAFY06_00055 [Pseudomonadota bacterium]
MQNQTNVKNKPATASVPTSNLAVAVAATVDGTPAVKLVAILRASGITRIDDLAALAGLSRRSVFRILNEMRGDAHVTQGDASDTQGDAHVTPSRESDTSDTKNVVQLVSPPPSSPPKKKKGLPPYPPLKKKNNPPTFPPPHPAAPGKFSDSVRARDIAGRAAQVLKVGQQDAEALVKRKISSHGGAVVELALDRMLDRIAGGETFRNGARIFGLICEDLTRERQPSTTLTLSRW